jgi:glycosyltransferase involved in cell wall biosynthesis
MKNPAVTFYCGDNVVPWGPPSLLEGIGGSEEAAIHMARHLHLLGCRVTVYGRPGAFAGVHEGVRWVAFDEFDPNWPGDIFIAWRDAAYVSLGERWNQVYHWVHNRQDFDYPEDAARLVDRILLVSSHHATDPGFDGIPRRKLFCTSNGLDEGFLRDPGRNEPHRVIYASCPARGLLALLDMWGSIKRKVSTARLDVFNGFTPVYEDMARAYPGLHYIKKLVLDRLDQDGVTFHGVVGQHRLAEGFAQAGVWAYPTDCRETSCITAMKALAMGCLPVTSGCGAITETLGGRDFGPADPEKFISESHIRMWTFRRRVVWAMKHGASRQMMARRLEWSRWARKRYSWRAIAESWLRLFAEVAAEKHGQRMCSVSG